MRPVFAPGYAAHIRRRESCPGRIAETLPETLPETPRKPGNPGKYTRSPGRKRAGKAPYDGLFPGRWQITVRPPGRDKKKSKKVEKGIDF